MDEFYADFKFRNNHGEKYSSKGINFILIYSL